MAGPERRAHLNLRARIEAAPAHFGGAKVAMIWMARGMEPDRLRELDAKLAGELAVQQKAEGIKTDYVDPDYVNAEGLQIIHNGRPIYKPDVVDGGGRPIYKPDVIEYAGWGSASREEIAYEEALKNLLARRAVERR